MSDDNIQEKFLSSDFSVYNKEDILKEVVKTGLDFYSGILRNGKTIQYKSFKELIYEFGESLPQNGISNTELIQQFRKIGAFSIAQSDPRYIGFPDSGNSFAAVSAAVYEPFLNQNLITFCMGSPVGTIIEMQVLEWLREIVGYDTKQLQEYTVLSDIGGMWTTGGVMSNTIAMLTALQHTFKDMRKEGIAKVIQKTRRIPVVIQAGDIAHYSHTQAAQNLGLGEDNVILTKTSENYTSNKQSIQEALNNLGSDQIPFMVIGVAGNCRTTSIDDLVSISNICREKNLWFHVDACHGGCLLFSDKYKKLVEGIELSDSVSLDPHKGLFVPYPQSYVLFRNRSVLKSTFARYPENISIHEYPDLGQFLPFFGSKGMHSLRMWSLIKSLGMKGIGTIIDERQKCAQFLGMLIKNSKYFLSFNDVNLYRQAFIYLPQRSKKCINQSSDLLDTTTKTGLKQIIDKYTNKICQELYKNGDVVFDSFKLVDLKAEAGLGFQKYTVLSWAIGNPFVSKDSLNKYFYYAEQIAKKYDDQILEEIIQALNKSIKKTVAVDNCGGPAGWS